MSPTASNFIILLLSAMCATTGLFVYLAFSARNRLRERNEELEENHTSMRNSIRIAHQQIDILQKAERQNQDIVLFFVVSMPELIRNLNASRDKRQIAPVLLKMIMLSLAPRQACLFYRSREGETFKLAAHHGLPEDIQQPFRVSATEGFIGVVAKHQAVMAAQDSRVSMGGTGPLMVDLCAPFIDPETQTTLGVITIGAPSKHQAEAKKMIKMVSDLGALAIKNTEYHHLIQTAANQDGLTEIYNKQFGTEQLAAALRKVTQPEDDLSVLLFDIDHFKHYNDTNGHLAGDEVLREIGRLLRENLRSEDFAARFGGEEFLVVFHGVNKKGAMTAAEKIRGVIGDHNFAHGNSQPGGRLTISGGVASMRTESRTSTELLQLADQALYEAKRTGRNRIVPYRASYLSGGREQDPSPGPARP